MNTKKAEAGIGTLVLFIAMILVAAIAAGVLIQTSTALQSKSLATGSEARSQISTKVDIINAWATNGSTGTNTLQSIYFKLGLAAGSDPISLNDTYISLDSETNPKQVLNYNATSNCTNVSSINPTTFGVTRRLGYTRAGFLVEGDIIDVCFNASFVIQRNQELQVMFVPRVGSAAGFVATTPPVITTVRVDLFP